MEKNSALVSIIIPCFNDYKYIEEAIRSAKAQTWVNKEIIVIDDGSDRKTKEVLNEIKSSIDLLITQENSGPSAARNRGIEKASGEYILVLDADDYFEPGFCEKAIKIFKNNNDIIMVTSYARWFESTTNYKIFKPTGGVLENYLFKNCSLGTMFNKRNWQKAKGYDEEMQDGYEDWEFYIRLHKNGGRTYVIPEILFHYRNTSTSRNKTANLLKYELEQYIYQKHAELYKIHFEEFVIYLMGRHKVLNNTINKRENSLEYQLGSSLLSPMRWVKNLFR